MRKVQVFNSISLDGYFTDPKNDISWAHKNSQDPEWHAWVAGNASGGGPMVFGRKTYEMMKSWWPTPAAQKNDPDVARHMNRLPKVVFSKTLARADWENTRLVKTDPVAAMKQMKQEPGEDMVIMGSGTIIALLAAAGLIDDYTMVVHPVVLGAGRTMFEGLKKPLDLEQTGARTFKNGNVVLNYSAR